MSDKEEKLHGNAKPIDKGVFEGLMRIFCTCQEACAVLGVSVSTLKKWIRKEYNTNFEEIAGQLRADGRASLRKWGFKHAQKDSATWRFLSKNYLGLSDNPVPVEDDTFGKAFARSIDRAAKALEKVSFGDSVQIPDPSRRVE